MVSVDRMTIGSIRQARASEPPKPMSLWVFRVKAVKMNSPITIDGTPAMTSLMNRMTRGQPVRGAVLGGVDGPEHAQGHGDQGRHPR